MTAAEIAEKIINATIGKGKNLRFTYIDGKGNTSERHVEPGEVKDGKLWAKDIDRDAIRCFTLDSIRALLPVDRPLPEEPK